MDRNPAATEQVIIHLGKRRLGDSMAYRKCKLGDRVCAVRGHPIFLAL